MPPTSEAKRARQKAYREANREKLKAYFRKHYAESRDKINAARRAQQNAYGRNNREWIREKARKWRETHRQEYREYMRTWQRKDNGIPDSTRPMPEKCECCGRATAKRLHLDHDHLTGSFRGWICVSCNLAIGMLGDCKAGVQLALDYLDRVTLESGST